MSNEANDTGASEGETPADDATEAADQGSGPAKDPVALMQSRLNGQTAKVGELTNTIATKDAELATVRARVEALESDKVSADDAATAKVAAAQALLDTERNARLLESRKSRFPETFEALGDGAAALDEVALAGLEARLTGEVAGEDLPTPLQHNSTRTGTTRTPAKEKTAADITAELLATPVPW